VGNGNGSVLYRKNEIDVCKTQRACFTSMVLFIDTSRVLHARNVKHWAAQASKTRRALRKLPTLWDIHAGNNPALALQSQKTQGDQRWERIKDIFLNGLDVEKWSEVQIKIFYAFAFCCLPLIYGDEWEQNKSRILDEWNETAAYYYALVNMARRNGKTFVTSGFAAAFFLAMEVKIAIFSTCKRTSQMMLEAVKDRIEGAFANGTRIKKQDYASVMENMETIVFTGPDGTKRIVGSFPGSVRVSIYVTKKGSVMYG